MVTREDRSREDAFRYLRSIVANAAHIVLRTDSVGMILDASDEVADVLGYAVSHVVGRSALDFVHEDDQHFCALELIREIEAPTRNSESIVVRLRHSHGHYLDMELQGFARLEDPLVQGVVVAIRDVTGNRRSQRAMAAGDYLFTATSTVASDATTIFDANGRRVYSSPSLERLIGYSSSELSVIAFTDLLHADDIALCERARAEALSTENGSSRVECRFRRKGGDLVWVEVTIVNLIHHDEVRGVVVHLRDITERRALDDELRRRAAEDSLTGLGNRRAFIERLTDATRDRCDFPITVLFCDLDGFKRVNDDYGHATGDALLRSVADCIETVITPNDFASRMGGDEFCILSRDLGSVDEAVEFAARVRNAIASVRTQRGEIAVSIGVDWGSNDSTPSEILSRADHAMYAAKHRGRNQIEVATRVGLSLESELNCSKVSDTTATQLTK